MKPLHSLRARLLIFGLCISLIPIAIITTIYYLNARNTLEKQTMEWVEAVAESREAQRKTFVESKKGRTTDFSSDGFIRDSLESINREAFNKQDKVTALNGHLSANKAPLDPNLGAIAVVDKNGKVVASTHKEWIGVDVSDQKTFTQALNKNYREPYVSQLSYCPYIKTMCIDISAPITARDSNDTIGVIINCYDIAALNEITANRAGMGETGEVVLGRREGDNIVFINSLRYAPDAPRSFFVPLGAPEAEPMKLALEGGDGVVVAPDYRGIDVVAAYKYIPFMDWGLVAKIDKSEAFAPVRTLGIVALIVGLVAAAVVIGVGIVFAFSTSRPIRKLTDATRRFAGGDLNHRVKIARKDEIGELADSFNAMAKDIVEKTREAVRAKELVKEIMAREHAEVSLLESEEKFHSICATAQDAIIMTDKEGKVSYWNEAAEKVFQYSAEEAVGNLLHELIIPNRFHEGYLKGLEGFRDTGRGAFTGKTVELVARKKDGTEFPMEHSVSAVMLKGKWNAVGILRDITERKRSEEKLKILRELDMDIITHTLDYDEMFEAATQLVNKIIPCDRVTMVLVDEEKKGFIYCYGWGTKARKKGDFVPFEMTDASRVIREKRTIVRSDLRKEGELKPLDKQFLEEGFLSDIRAPLIIKGRVEGLLNIGNRRTDVFTRDDVTTAETIATQLSIALENSLLFKKLEESLGERKQNLEELRKALGRTIQALAAVVETRDPYTAGHQQRVADLVRAIATEMDLSPERIEGICMAGIIHDIGKIAVPAEILSKPGKITATEFNMIKTHPQAGYDILKGIEFPWPVAKIVLQH